MLTEKQIEYLESNGYKQIADEYVALNGNIFNDKSRNLVTSVMR